VPEAKICELGVSVVNPKTVTIKHKGKNLTYSYREIDDLIGWFITDVVVVGLVSKFNRKVRQGLGSTNCVVA
jgi:hypothetical protein